MPEDDRPTPLDETEPWLVGGDGDAVRTAARLGVPTASLALYARWWQLEAWLRELVYVELRALHGREWGDVVRAASGRQSADASYTHMQGADNKNPLAYLDYSQIVSLIDEHWDTFEYALLTKKAWDGRQEELKRIRHRIGTCAGHTRTTSGGSSRRSGTSSVEGLSLLRRTTTTMCPIPTTTMTRSLVDGCKPSITTPNV
jgi:hypothetical protein